MVGMPFECKRYQHRDRPEGEGGGYIIVVGPPFMEKINAGPPPPPFSCNVQYTKIPAHLALILQAEGSNINWETSSVSTLLGT